MDAVHDFICWLGIRKLGSVQIRDMDLASNVARISIGNEIRADAVI